MLKMSMSKSPHFLLIKAIDECLKNAISFLSDAKLLMNEKSSYGHAFSLCVLADEETAKAFFLKAVSQEILKYEDIQHHIYSHQSKLKIQILLELVEKTISSNLLETLINLEPYYEEMRIQLVNNHFRRYRADIRKKREYLNKRKQNGFYVEIKGDDVLSPNSFSEDETRSFYREVKSRLKMFKEFQKKNIKVPVELLEVWKSEWVVDSL